ncbi:MAG: hypothetical protein Q7S58_05105 [Candidatus Binatus sp.]|uniref:hypothetical protein n=1 Tax=Candidatus Binatus sp. TaxID=2811406 RepID=UPI00271A405B|nr:hypothetical protein [Candidatus Binatus sp.]MDO8431771.1 hypothetical protein [Candidatus Binatus sp.]
MAEQDVADDRKVLVKAAAVELEAALDRIIVDPRRWVSLVVARVCEREIPTDDGARQLAHAIRDLNRSAAPLIESLDMTGLRKLLTEFERRVDQMLAPPRAPQMADYVEALRQKRWSGGEIDGLQHFLDRNGFKNIRASSVELSSGRKITRDEVRRTLGPAHMSVEDWMNSPQMRTAIEHEKLAIEEERNHELMVQRSNEQAARENKTLDERRQRARGGNSAQVETKVEE